MEPTVPPTQRFLDTVAEFERHVFSSPKVRQLSDAIDAGGPIPDLDPPLTEFEQLGKEPVNGFVVVECRGVTREKILKLSAVDVIVVVFWCGRIDH